MDIRSGQDRDLEQLNAIYNHYVRTAPCTFDVDPIPLDARRSWFEQFGTRRHRLFVAVDEDEVVGYACSMRWLSARAAYDTSVAVTVYVRDGRQGQGIGKAMYARLFAAIGDEDIHRAYAGITMPNDGSVALHESFGFRQAGYFTEQGRKFGRYWDVAWFEKKLEKELS